MDLPKEVLMLLDVNIHRRHFMVVASAAALVAVSAVPFAHGDTPAAPTTVWKPLLIDPDGRALRLINGWVVEAGDDDVR
jgi:hypothetical protein